MTFHIITIFPEMFDSYLQESIIGRAIADKKIKIKFYNPLDFCEPKRRVDDRPYGGGPGMVLRPEIFLKFFETALIKITEYKLITKWNFSIKPEKNFNKLIEIPINEKYDEVIKLFS